MSIPIQLHEAINITFSLKVSDEMSVNISVS